MLEPEELPHETAFKCPCVPLIPCLGIVFNFILCTVGVGKMEWLLFLLFEFTGFLFYILYGYKNSLMPAKVRRHNLRNSLNYST